MSSSADLLHLHPDTSRSGSLCYPFHSVRGRADIDLSRTAGGTPIPFVYVRFELRDAVLANQVDSAASETSTCHSSPVNTWGLTSQIHHQIELGTAHFKIFAQAFVRFSHQDSESLKIPPLQSRCGLEHTSVLGDHVAATAHDRFRQIPSIGRQIA